MITLATLPQATAQEVFDQCATHLLTQNRKSYKRYEDTCAYRGANGLVCAAGCFIADDEYDSEDFESRGWGRLVSEGIVPAEHQHLIGRLQRIHDIADVDQWRGELLYFAKNNGYSTGVFAKFEGVAA